MELKAVAKAGFHCTLLFDLFLSIGVTVNTLPFIVSSEFLHSFMRHTIHCIHVISVKKFKTSNLMIQIKIETIQGVHKVLRQFYKDFE